jgi:hypothetical protein
MRSSSRLSSSRVIASSAPNGSSISRRLGSIGQQRAADRYPLLHAARQLARILRLEAAEAGQLEQVAGGLAVLAHVAAQHLDGEEHVVEDGAPRQQDRMLEDEADVGEGLAHRLAVDGDGAARGRREPGHQLEQRALAAAAGADQRDELVVGDVERDVLDGVHEVAPTRAVGLLDVVETDHRGSRSFVYSSSSGTLRLSSRYCV